MNFKPEEFSPSDIYDAKIFSQRDLLNSGVVNGIIIEHGVRPAPIMPALFLA